MKYETALDIFPLSEEIVMESPVLGSTLQSVALDGLLGVDVVEKLDVLLKLASDLGYTSPEIVTFLRKRIKER